MFKVKLDYQVTLQGRSAQLLDPVLFTLLNAIHESGSISKAAQATGYSYRHVWGMVGRWQEFFEQPLVELLRGRGARLTPFGEKLMWLEQRARSRVAPQLESLATELERELAALLHDPGASLVIHASHDLALGRVRDLLAERRGMKVDLQFRGSLDALAALGAGKCDLAGFHVADALGKSSLTHLSFRQWLKPRTQKLIHFVTRQQGLMVAPGNPKQVFSLSDLARPDVRFINRQRGSGTRLLIDELLWQAEINRTALNGYQVEEFTHLAVAATVAGHMADAGFGIAAAARQFGLDFIPLAQERYLFACRAEAIADATVQQMLEELKGAEFQNLVRDLEGYDATGAGEVVSFAEALPWYEKSPGSRRRQPPPR